ncbi:MULTISPECIES: Wzz/FepE/Etk N-terminal domain-containing protein [Kribbella]|uniref:Capsular polysaccharide biosynthesis protein n=1 Tax=Kribbella pratensis TaxID=2512112 RepID=A0ABY2FMC0_9ACTN|nr:MULTISPECIES: Wzz/FepE/Etk N-terminal domain-containing protein [Kribbella]TDW94258.1 capsular polysaccharide biosynthesis protein [Kribbella pratensis]TDX02863.1 capsular polysaccharide biosynthesis protein [Kribbella sp. VKM Ac-2566]
MSTQELDVKKAFRAILRHRRLVGAVAAVGLLGGIGAGLLIPPQYSASSLVLLPAPPKVEGQAASSEQNIDTQVFIASSEPVLKSAGQNVSPVLGVEEVKKRIKVQSATADVIQIKSRGVSRRQATSLANAVADVYLVFVTTEQKLPGDLGKKTGARVLERATTASGGGLAPHLALYGLLGLVGGALLGAVAALVIARSDRRLRLRDEIADAIGLPVLASVSSYRAKGVSDWSNLLDRYTPPAVDAWSLRKTLHHLGLDPKENTSTSLTVISFTEDEAALPFGPQLAAYAKSIGIATSLVVGNYHEAPAVVPGTVVGSGNRVQLDILVVVVDRDEPQLNGVLGTSTTVVAVAAGAVTAEELARLAVAADDADRTIDGIIVTDPDPSDRTIGRVPRSMRRSGASLPTLLSGAARRRAR